MPDPEKFFQISRHFYVPVNSTEKIDDYYGNLSLSALSLSVDIETWLSGEKVPDFKKWTGK